MIKDFELVIRISINIDDLNGYVGVNLNKGSFT